MNCMYNHKPKQFNYDAINPRLNYHWFLLIFNNAWWYGMYRVYEGWDSDATCNSDGTLLFAYIKSVTVSQKI